MSPEQNKTIVRHFYEEVMNKGNVELLDQLMHPDFLDHGETLFGSPRGRDVLKQLVAGVHSIFPGLTVTIEDMIAWGDMVGVRGLMRCTHAGEFIGVLGTGNELSWKGLAMFRVVDGKIAERWFNSDSLSILHQLGIEPTTG